VAQFIFISIPRSQRREIKSARVQSAKSFPCVGSQKSSSISLKYRVLLNVFKNNAGAIGFVLFLVSLFTPAEKARGAWPEKCRNLSR